MVNGAGLGGAGEATSLFGDWAGLRSVRVSGGRACEPLPACALRAHAYKRLPGVAHRRLRRRPTTTSGAPQLLLLRMPADLAFDIVNGPFPGDFTHGPPEVVEAQCAGTTVGIGAHDDVSLLGDHRPVWPNQPHRVVVNPVPPRKHNGCAARRATRTPFHPSAATSGVTGQPAFKPDARVTGPAHQCHRQQPLHRMGLARRLSAPFVSLDKGCHPTACLASCIVPILTGIDTSCLD